MLQRSKSLLNSIFQMYFDLNFHAESISVLQVFAYLFDRAVAAFTKVGKELGVV